MPFLMVYGVPDGTPKELLRDLRQVLVRTITEEMSTPTQQVPAHYIRVFFPQDLLQEPSEVAEGAQTIYGRLETAMFKGLPGDDYTKLQLPQRVTGRIAHVIWAAFEGQREVEVFVGELNPDHKTLIKAMTAVA